VIGSQFDDVLIGGRFAEQLTGGEGDDQITGGAGQDVLSGGYGNDRIDARDMEADTVDCGGGELDWAAVDVGLDTAVTRCAEVVGS
jgi:Ca2+-binding RTX toxin-like protein